MRPPNTHILHCKLIFFTMQNIWGFCKPILFHKTKREVSINSKSWMLIEMKSKECKTCFTRLPKQHPMLSTCDLAEKCLNKFKKWNKNMSKNGTLLSCKTTSFTSEKKVSDVGKGAKQENVRTKTLKRVKHQIIPWKLNYAFWIRQSNIKRPCTRAHSIKTQDCPYFLWRWTHPYCSYSKS